MIRWLLVAITAAALLSPGFPDGAPDPLAQTHPSSPPPPPPPPPPTPPPRPPREPWHRPPPSDQARALRQRLHQLSDEQIALREETAALANRIVGDTKKLYEQMLKAGTPESYQDMAGCLQESAVELRTILQHVDAIESAQAEEFTALRQPDPERLLALDGIVGEMKRVLKDMARLEKAMRGTVLP